MLLLLALAGGCVGPGANADDKDTAPFSDGDADTDTDADTDADTATDTATDPVVDRDVDGWEGAAGTGEDCDDDDATVHPGAYDRPNDGIDGDCDGADRAFDGVVVSAGSTVDVPIAYEAPGPVGLDIALLLDTSCAMDGNAMLDVPSIAAAVGDVGDARWAFATYEDYPIYEFGSSSSGDLPFRLGAQMTDDVAALQGVVRGALTHGGGDQEEAGMEALYQALTGAGYDLDCDGVYNIRDVRPFIPASDDVFGGTADGAYEPTVSGTGAGGGVGFREDGQPVLVLVTDNYLRDPDSLDARYNEGPGGCDDAGSVEVIEAARAANAWIVGIAVNGTLPTAQLSALSAATGRLVDLDGDGAFGEAPVYEATLSTLNDRIAESLDAVAAAATAGASYELVELVVGVDPYDLVIAPVPDTFTDVAPGDDLSFTLTVLGPAADDPIETTVEVWVYGDGVLLDTIVVPVEIAPG